MVMDVRVYLETDPSSENLSKVVPVKFFFFFFLNIPFANENELKSLYLYSSYYVDFKENVCLTRTILKRKLF